MFCTPRMSIFNFIYRHIIPTILLSYSSCYECAFLILSWVYTIILHLAGFVWTIYKFIIIIIMIYSICHSWQLLLVTFWLQDVVPHSLARQRHQYAPYIAPYTQWLLSAGNPATTVGSWHPLFSFSDARIFYLHWGWVSSTRFLDLHIRHDPNCHVWVTISLESNPGCWLRNPVC